MPRQLPDDPRPWEVLRQDYIFRRPPWLTLRQQHMRLPTGREISEYWIYEFPPWVNVVAVTDDDHLVMVRQYRPGLSAVHYELVAGVVDDSDPSLEAAARRELAEETGYGGGTWTPLMSLAPNPATQNNLSHSFLAQGVRPIKEAQPEATEDIRVHLIPVAEAADLVAAGEIVQALHAAPLLQYLMRRGR